MLSERDLYGYEINKLIQQKYVHFTRVSVSTIYYTLDGLESNGYIMKREEKVGNRPARSIYQITSKGKKEFENILNLNLKKENLMVCMNDPYNLPFSLMGRLPPDEVEQLLKKREAMIGDRKIEMMMMRQSIGDLSESDDHSEYDLFTLLLIDRGIAHLEAEEGWIREVIEIITSEEQ